MPTPLTDAIQALTRYANETTGQSDTTLSEAVNTLIDGYEGGDFITYYTGSGAPSSSLGEDGDIYLEV